MFVSLIQKISLCHTHSYRYNLQTPTLRQSHQQHPHLMTSFREEDGPLHIALRHLALPEHIYQCEILPTLLRPDCPVAPQKIFSLVMRKRLLSLFHTKHHHIQSPDQHHQGRPIQLLHLKAACLFLFFLSKIAVLQSSLFEH